MVFISRGAAACALACIVLLSGCAGDSTLISKPWNSLRPTAKSSKPKKPSERSASRSNFSDDIPAAASVGLAVSPDGKSR